MSFGLQADYQAVVDALRKSGIRREFSATLRAAGKAGGASVSYLAMQNRMGGFQLEIAGST
jgi:hypothetical protein